ncbi:hypothetical protein VOI54_01830 [Tamlana sp. 2201CG12-4]|uniref:hypothetical protein n=1 Tax=Tamlana sp. 2201CG12-4 TaxID=3112582 RepID=UPI002DB91B06|nr:hypothetical protein [Tamlana sp. 2201CG12-4]MEC3905748.1 hypothetical protein [Tamlana sp. 2201CG12-4]
MFELLEGLITKPFNTFLGIIILWGIFYLVFVKLLKLRGSIWHWFEYSWIFVGVFGVLFLVAENRKNRSVNRLEFINNRLKNDVKDLKNYSEISNHCFKYNNSGLLSQEVFDKRQAEQDSVCSWMKKVKAMAEKSINNNYILLDKIPVINIENYQALAEYKHVLIVHQRINEQIKNRDELTKIINDDFWEGYKYTFGILFLIIAFALRLTIVSKKISEK